MPATDGPKPRYPLPVRPRDLANAIRKSVELLAAHIGREARVRKLSGYERRRARQSTLRWCCGCGVMRGASARQRAQGEARRSSRGYEVGSCAFEVCDTHGGEVAENQRPKGAGLVGTGGAGLSLHASQSPASEVPRAVHRVPTPAASRVRAGDAESARAHYACRAPQRVRGPFPRCVSGGRRAFRARGARADERRFARKGPRGARAPMHAPDGGEGDRA